MSIAILVGQRIRFYRKRKKLSQERLAEICNFHPTYIGQLERGEKNATLESIYRISQGLNISINQLLENVDKLASDTDSIPLQVYHQLSQIPEEKQKDIQKFINDLLDLMNKY